ncbi:MAG: GNAT family N-acetyltransferase [Candidatus Latescibacteria bacterium]|nr:GNAT family N-acetyltransferase [Candidatus Latescibacterota bacterium]
MIIRAATETELEEIAELQHLVFRPNEPDVAQRYLSYTNDDPAYTLDHSRVISQDGRLVCHLRIWDRTLRVRGADLLAAGIGSLCTHPDFRGRGYAQALMRDSEKYFFEAGYDLGLLFTIIGTPFYEAQGWVPIPLPTFAFGKMNALPMPEGVRQLDVVRDLEAVRAIYEDSGLRYESAALRDQVDWTAGPAQIRGNFPTLGVIREGQLVAYVSLAFDDEEVWIKEVCALGGCEDAYEQLAQAVMSVCDGKKLEGSLPRDHLCITVLEALTGIPATWDTHDEMMVKGVNWNSLREKVGGEVVSNIPPNDEDSFWRNLLGERPFYWWTDIFIFTLAYLI